MTKKNAGSAPPDLDWNLVRAFLAVIDTGSLTAGAAQFGASQPTLSRKIEELESCIGTEPHGEVCCST